MQLRQAARERRFAVAVAQEADGEVVYTHQTDRSHVLVAPNVAAEMIDLLQTAVNTGTGRAAQIGRPVAGKTGTTTSGKDGWFLGFSSGLTTGVWIGRDDARPVPGLHGGTAPARTFAAFMGPATRNRPIEQFLTAVTMPDDALANQEEAYFGEPDDSVGTGVDADGNPLPDTTPPPDQPDEGGTDPPQGGSDPLADLIEKTTRDDRQSPPPIDRRRLPLPRELPREPQPDERPTQ